MNNYKLKHTHLQSIMTAKQNGFYQYVSANASIYRRGLVKARNWRVSKHFPDFHHLTMVNARIYW